MKFNEVKLTRDQVVAAARSYKGMRYDAYHNLDGVCGDCAGFMIMLMKRLGLLDADFRIQWELSRPRILAEILRENFTEVSIIKPAPGDLLRFNFDNSDGRHIAVKSTCSPAPHGSIVHCINGRVTNNGAVVEQRIDARMEKYLFRAYRLNQWVK